MDPNTQQYLQFEVSLRQLITLLNLVTDDHISSEHALTLLEAVGVNPLPQRTTAGPAHVQHSALSRPRKRHDEHASPSKVPQDEEIFELASKFGRSVKISAPAGSSSSSKGKARVRGHPPASANVLPCAPPPPVMTGGVDPRSSAEKRWYCVTSGEVVGAVQSWSGTQGVTSQVPGNCQSKARDHQEAVQSFLHAAVNSLAKIRSSTGNIVGIPGIDNMAELENWLARRQGPQ